MQDAIGALFSQIPRLNAERKRNGKEPIIDLSVGEPFLNIHNGIIADLNAFLASAQHDFIFKYTQVGGNDECLQAICELYRLYYPNVNFSLGEVMLCNGATQGIWNALNIALKPKDKVLLFEPYFSLYMSQIEALGGHAIKMPTLQQGFLPSAKLLQKTLQQHPNAKVIILNYPNNPSGITLSEKQSLAMAHVLQSKPSLTIILDDVYRELSLIKHTSILDVMPALKNQCIVVNSASKGLIGAPGMRIGMIGAKREWIQAMQHVQTYTISSMAILTERLLISAIKHRVKESDEYKDWIKETKANYAANLKYLTQKLSELGFRIVGGEHGFFILADASFLQVYSNPKMLLTTDQEIASFLLHEAGVASVRGSAFGIDKNACFLRFSCAKPKVILEQALLNIEAAQELLARQGREMNGKD